MKKHNQEERESKRMRKEQTGEPGKVTIGLDLGDQHTHYCVLHGKAEILEQGRVRTRKKELRELLERYQEAEVGLEAGTHSRWVSQVIAESGQEAVVAHARELRKIYESDRKNDGRDAEMLARILRLDRRLFHPVELRDGEMQADLAVVRSRAALVRARTMLVCTVRSLVKNFGETLPGCGTASFSRRVGARIPPALRPAVEPLLRLLQQSEEALGQLDRQVEALAARKYPQTELLEQVTGVGRLTALVYVLTLWKRERFARSREVGPYLGLTPGRDQSGARDPEQRITKAGNSYLRSLLVQSAHYILGPFGPDTALRRFGKRLALEGGGSKKGKKRAVVAVARKLAVLLHKLWGGEVYEPLRGIEQAAA